MSRPRTESTTSWSTAAAEESGEEGIDVDPYVLGEVSNAVPCKPKYNGVSYTRIFTINLPT